MVKFLIENGGKVDMIDNTGRTAIEYADEDNKKVRLLLEANSRRKKDTVHVRTNSF